MTWLRDENTSTSAKYAYNKGTAAATNKQKLKNNPYPKNSNQHLAWAEGFNSTHENPKNPQKAELQTK